MNGPFILEGEPRCHLHSMDLNLTYVQFISFREPFCIKNMLAHDANLANERVLENRDNRLARNNNQPILLPNNG